MNTWQIYSAISSVLLLLLLGLYVTERRRHLGFSAELEGELKQVSSRLDHDELTGLLAPGAFDTLLDQAVQQANHSGGSICVLCIALDNFGLISDGFGRAISDRILREVAGRLNACAGAQSPVCRVAGTEFAFIVNGGLAIGRLASERVKVEMIKPFEWLMTSTGLTCSIGLAIYPENGRRERLLDNAAMAMRNVKLNGGDAFCQFDAKMGVELRQQAALVNDLRSALEKGQFELFFQPKIDALSLQVTAAEALLRWHHPERGLVSPVIFIPLAEKYGLMGSIGNWVIDEACRTAAHWKESGLRMRVAVNISGYQMREDDLVERIEAALRRYELRPERFTCEITESVAMENTTVTRLTFDKMRKAGFHVSIDDFGTGYSSLAALRRLPAAELKIDRAFVVDLLESKDARLIASSIINMAKALNLRVVAEGVETTGQRDLLVKMGCDELQGFLFSLPVTAQELQRMALDRHSPENAEFRDSLFATTIIEDL